MSDEDGGGTEEPEDGVPRDPGQLLGVYRFLSIYLSIYLSILDNAQRCITVYCIEYR